VAEFSATISAEGVCVVAVDGELDLAVVDDFLATARTASAGCSALEIDLDRMSFVDSSGLGALMRLRKEAAEQDIALRLVNMPPAAHRLFQITGLLEIFDIRPRQD
jgi:anti-anti-sigma factor